MADVQVPSRVEQGEVFQNLLAEMQKQGQLIVPQLPEGDTVAAPVAKSSPTQAGPKDAAQQQVAQTAPMQNKPIGSVTTGIANQGQLIPIPGTTSAQSSSDDTLAQIKHAIQGLSGEVNNSQAQTQQAVSKSSGGGGGGSDVIGDVLDVAAAVVGWVICTELVRQHRLPMRYYIVGARVFAAYNPIAKEGYFLWAIPSVRHLRAHPYSLYSRFLALVFNWRAENIAAHAGVRGARKLKRGAAVTAVLWPLCYVLGYTLHLFNIKQDWTKLYAENTNELV